MIFTDGYNMFCEMFTTMSIRKVTIALTAVLAVVMVVPAPVAAIDIIDQVDYTEEFNNSTNPYDGLYGENETLDVAAVNITDDKARFKANITGGGLNDSNGLQIYIDSTPNDDVGLDAETDAGDLGTFFEGLGSMTADYRISVRDGGIPVIQEYDEGIIFNTKERVTIEEKGDVVALEIDRATIGDPEKFEAKFAYVDEIGSADNKNKFVWAPNSSIEINDTQISQVNNAEFNTTVRFGDENVSDAASVEFILEDDTGEIASRTFNDYTGNTTINAKFTRDVKNIEGEVSFTVEVNDGENYSTSNDNLNNTVIIGEGFDDGEYNATIPLSVIEASVEFGQDPDINQGTSIEYNLINNTGDTVRSTTNDSFDSSSTPVNQTFTVNPVEFNNEGKVSVEVSGDDNYPLDNTKSVANIQEGNSLSSTSGSTVIFNASKIGQRFTLTPNQSSLNFDDDNGFSLNVSLESDDGENISQINHTIAYNESLIIEDRQDITFYNASPPNSSNDLEKISINNDSGEVEVDLTNVSGSIVPNGTNQTLYGINFTFENGLQDETLQGNENALELGFSTISDETKITNLSAEVGAYPSFTSSSGGPVAVTNPNTKITDVNVTHLTEGGDMVDAPTKFEINVETNDGELDKIRLNKTNQSGFTTNLSKNDADDKLVIDCGSGNANSTCDGTLQYTPNSTNDTFSDSQYDESFWFNITIVDSAGNRYHVPNDVDSVDTDTTRIDIYRFGDVDDSTLGGLGEEDVREVLKNVGEETTSLPWSDKKLARADINNDGEITMTDVVAVYNEFNS